MAKSESMHVLFTSTILRQTFNSSRDQSYEISEFHAYNIDVIDKLGLSKGHSLNFKGGL
jgi:hypothetical protein